MTDTLFELVPLTPEEAAAKGYARLHIDLGDPALSFSTYVRKDSVVERCGTLDTIGPAGIGWLASIHVPETPDAFKIDVDAFVFDHAVEAQPCAIYALQTRGLVLVPETGQRGLLIGGSIGIHTDKNGNKVRAARSHAVVRGRKVLVISMDFPFAGSDAALEEAGVLVANLAFDMPEATRFLPGDVTTIELPLPGQPFTLAFPSIWEITLNSFPEEKPDGVVLFALGDPKNSNGLMTFGCRQDASEEDAATLDAWTTRIAEQYRVQNPTIFGPPKLIGKAIMAKLEDAGAANRANAFHLDRLMGHGQNQIQVMVVASGNDRYTLSMMTTVTAFEDFHHFLVYAVGVTAYEMMSDSLCRRLTGSGF